MSNLIERLRDRHYKGQEAMRENAADALEARDKTIAELVEKNKGLQDVLEEKRETINSLRAIISQTHSMILTRVK